MKVPNKVIVLTGRASPKTLYADKQFVLPGQSIPGFGYHKQAYFTGFASLLAVPSAGTPDKAGW